MRTLAGGPAGDAGPRAPQLALTADAGSVLAAQAEALMDEVRKMASHLAGFAPFVPQFMKAMVNAGMEGSLATGLALEKFAQAALVQTEDKHEGISAFLEKRDPVWKGR